jgi:hypothetical protein
VPFLACTAQAELEAVRRESEETLQAVQAALDDTQVGSTWVGGTWHAIQM